MQVIDGLTKAWRDSENGQSACPVCVWQTGHADSTLKIARLPVSSGTGRRDNGKGPGQNSPFRLQAVPHSSVTYLHYSGDVKDLRL